MSIPCAVGVGAGFTNCVVTPTNKNTFENDMQTKLSARYRHYASVTILSLTTMIFGESWCVAISK